MGRTIHYRTKQAVKLEELVLLKRIEGMHNKARRWKKEGIKLWLADAVDPFPRGTLWGFTKVDDDRDGRLVLRAVEEMSKATPRLTWLVYDEGGLTKGRKLVLKRGNAIDAQL